LNQIIFGAEAREKIKLGVDQLANAVKPTYGAKGRNVIISLNAMKPKVTKDGVTVAKSIELNDPVENIGAQMVKEAASKTNDMAGDGTTTATILTQAIVEHGFILIKPEHNINAVKKGLDNATIVVVQALKKLSKKAKTQKTKAQIATISANGDKEIGNLVADTLTRVGDNGVVTVEDSSGTDTTVEFSDGMEFDNGYLSSYFVTNHTKATTEFINPLVLLYDGYLQDIKEILHLLKFSVTSARPLLIIAEDVESVTLNTLAYNCSNGELKVACVKAPGFGERRRAAFDDIAALTGAIVVSKEEGGKLLEVTESVLGSAEKALIKKDTTTITGGLGNKQAIEDQIGLIKMQISIEPEGRERDHKESRLSKLTGGAAIIMVGGFSEVEKREKGERITDALCATRAAIAEGYIAGGGVSYIQAAKKILDMNIVHKDEQVGHNILHSALHEPFIQIMRNAGLNENESLNTVVYAKPGTGINVVTEKVVNLVKAGIIDATKVQRVALENASSIAGTFLTSEVIIYNEESFM
jgi:chaperonin GroEL